MKSFKKPVTLIWRQVQMNDMIFIFVVFYLSVCPSMLTLQSQDESSGKSCPLVCVSHPDLGWNCFLISPSLKGHQCKPSFGCCASPSPVPYASEDLSSFLPHLGCFWNVLVRWMGIADLIVLLITNTEKMEKAKTNSYRFYSWIRRPLCLACQQWRMCNNKVI